MNRNEVKKIKCIHLIILRPVKKTEINDRGNQLLWPHNTIYPQKLALLRQQAAVARSA
jgi:hypothetical protein